MNILWGSYTDYSMKSKKKSKKDMVRDEVENYFDACMLIGFEQMTLNDVEAYNPLNNRSRSPDNVSICYKYTSCPLDLTFDTLEEALAQGTFNKHHVKGECWINSLMDFYGDTI
jgi:hypothetical protein